MKKAHENNEAAYYSGPIKEEYLAQCRKCSKPVDNRWNYCPACGSELSAVGISPSCSNTVGAPHSGQ